MYKSYNKIALWFDKNRNRELFERSYLDKVISYLKPKAKILDLGCGMGEPIAKYFINQGFRLIGIDGSEELIKLAKSRFPKSKFIISDMRNLNLGKKFDCIIAWHSLFHLPAKDQEKMFFTFSIHLNKNGILLFTTGSEAGEIWSDNGGEMLYHASLSPQDYMKLLNNHNFELIKYKLSDPECCDTTVWLAQYKE